MQSAGSHLIQLPKKYSSLPVAEPMSGMARKIREIRGKGNAVGPKLLVELRVINSQPDRFSRMRIPSLKNAVPAEVYSAAEEVLGAESSLFMQTLRWWLRGLPLQTAIWKAQLEEELKGNTGVPKVAHRREIWDALVSLQGAENSKERLRKLRKKYQPGHELVTKDRLSPACYQCVLVRCVEGKDKKRTWQVVKALAEPTDNILEVDRVIREKATELGKDWHRNIDLNELF